MRNTESVKKKIEKADRASALKIVLPENVSEKILNASEAYGGEEIKYANFQIMAMMLYADIVRWLEIQKADNGEIPQNTRELSVFLALVFAKQAGLITSYEEFEAKAKELIEFCGH